MVKVSWSEKALNDIDEIADYLAQYSLSFAQKTVSQLFDSVDILERLPKAGRIVPELNTPQIREIIQGKYRMIYEIKESENVILVEILTIHPSAIPL